MLHANPRSRDYPTGVSGLLNVDYLVRKILVIFLSIVFRMSHMFFLDFQTLENKYGLSSFNIILSIIHILNLTFSVFV